MEGLFAKLAEAGKDGCTEIAFERRLKINPERRTEECYNASKTNSQTTDGYIRAGSNT